MQQAVQENDAMLVQEQGGREEEHTLLQQEQDAVGPCVSEQVYIDSENCKKFFIFCALELRLLSPTMHLSFPWTKSRGRHCPRSLPFIPKIMTLSAKLFDVLKN